MILNFSTSHVLGKEACNLVLNDKLHRRVTVARTQASRTCAGEETLAKMACIFSSLIIKCIGHVSGENWRCRLQLNKIPLGPGKMAQLIKFVPSKQRGLQLVSLAPTLKKKKLPCMEDAAITPVAMRRRPVLSGLAESVSSRFSK